MLYKKLFPVFFLCSMLSSCQNDPEVTDEETVTTDTIQYSYDIISRELLCEEDTSELCLDVKIKQININDGPSDTAVQKIGSALERAIMDTDNSPGDVKSPEELAENLVKEYQRIMGEIPDYSMPWSYEVSINVFLNQNGLFGAEINTFSFTGGAHGNYFTFYYLFNMNNGQRILLEDLLKNNAHARLLAMADEQFRESRGLNSEADYNEMGYWFEENTFTLPENFKYSGEGLEFRYNPYEVAPYSEGEIVLLFPLAEIRELIKPEYQLSPKEKEVL